jgi:sulfonate transport system substrate-binding protein
VLSAIIDELGKVTAQAARNRAELAQVAAQATGIDEEIWRIAFDRAQYGVTPVSAAQVAQQQKLADTFLALGIVPRKVQVQDIVWHAPGGK